MSRGAANEVIGEDGSSGVSDPPFLTLCLHGCLAEAEAHSALAGVHLRHAIAALENGRHAIATDGMPRTTTAHAVAAYLEYLIPDVATRSSRAVGSIRSAIQSLRDPPDHSSRALH